MHSAQESHGLITGLKLGGLNMTIVICLSSIEIVFLA